MQDDTVFQVRRGLSELVLLVRDVLQSARFYREVVGLVPNTEPDESWAWFWAGAAGAKQRIALHKGPLFFDEQSPLPAGERWGRVHYAFEVPRAELESAVTHVRAAGVKVYGPTPLRWMRALSYYFYDPDGNLLEGWSPEPEGTSDYHLVHANVAHARAALDSPVMAGFASQVDEINSLARRAAGFVAQPTLPDEGVIYTAPFLLNVSIWESIESLEAFTHQGKHASALERREQWFQQGGTNPRYVLFWIPNGHILTGKEVKERLDYLGEYGATPYAFTFEQPFTAAQASDFQPAEDQPIPGRV